MNAMIEAEPLSEPRGADNGFSSGGLKGWLVGGDFMPVTSSFWTSVHTGLTAPVALFSAPPSYDAFTVILQPAQCFAIVGAYIQYAAGQVIVDDGRTAYTAERAA